jgi:lysophospholipase L1-like esterase
MAPGSCRRAPGWRGLVPLGVVGVVVGALLGVGPAGASGHGRVEYDVSVGDSYAAGYQPVADATAHRDTNGFAYQVIDMAKAKGDEFTLRNFACDGATTATILQQAGCSLSAPGPDSESYPGQTQAAAADRFIAHHPGQIGLITVSIGGNDILGCAAAAILIPCVTNALTGIEENLHQLLSGLRAAAGPGVPMVGLTYPDVFLGYDTSQDPAQRNLAVVSEPAFEQVLNPALSTQYTAAGATFVDVTKASGGYIPLTETTRSGSHGVTPVAVTDVCALTYACRLHDVHPTTLGYALIARLIVATLPTHHRSERGTRSWPPRRSDITSPRGWTAATKRSPRRATRSRDQRRTLPGERHEPHNRRSW